MFVSGPIGASTTGSGCERRIAAMRSTAPSGRGSAGDGGRRRPADARLAVDLGRADDRAEERAGRALRDGHVRGAVQVQQAEGVRRAVPDIGVAADRRDGEQVDLGSRHREPDRERVVEARGRCR